jgi:pimeloyl-ACP methyl ester carboxylesterase
MERTDRFVTVEDTEIHYSAWGDETAPPVVCAHGLSRVGRDFDPIARSLADTYRVLCPDMPGRGLSEWADDPATEYTDEAMVRLVVDFCDTLDLDSIRWIGTSMGGGLGMALAGGPLADRITHLVVNDISPDPTNDADTDALGRIVEYVPNPPRVDTVTELEAYYRETYESLFSEMTDEEWRRFTVTSMRRTDDGQVTSAYDPRIIESLTEDSSETDADPWEVWEAILADIFIVHGTESGILPPEALDEMLERQPDTEVLDVECGHAPALNVDEQIEPIRDFLAR